MTSTTSTHSRPRRGAVLSAATFLAVILALGACSAGDSGASSDSADVAQGSGGNVGADEGGAEPEAQTAADGSAPAAASPQQVVQVGELSMTVEDVRVAADAVVDLAETAGGRVDDRTEHDATADTRGTASLKIRVPSSEVTATLASLRKLGTVEQVDLHSQDVTNAAKDLDARIHGLQLSVARMQDLLARATTNEAIVQAENALTERQTSLEQLQSQRALLADQVRLSTLTITLTGPEVVPAPEPAPEPVGPQSFLEGLATGWAAFAGMVRVAVIVLGVLLPWLAFGGAVAAGAVAVSRWRRTRSAARGPVVPAPVPVPAPVEPSDDEARS
ncbi:DUF4349 domain-containing protein [Cellulomonas sp.]|uniref:DUF4349 domain-containing protein n=1 Tax=Cellulomonas sp. TaxID=40001 RepID=UPI001B29ADC0|nr:DUF4349 domain-containing protein [Cellulomonas sp.]MBO9554365.1 DUF4349 domain-containing protein [Cellulomonas sp.]